MHEDDDSLDCAHRVPTGVYQGHELTAPPARPGSMEPYALPSRMGSKRVYRDGRTEETGSAPAFN